MSKQTAKRLLTLESLGRLIAALQQRGFEVIGPTLQDGAVVYGPVESLEDLPAGWTAEQEAGSYRLKRREDGAVFGYAVGPRSMKKFLHPSETRLFAAERDNGVFRILNTAEPAPRRAYLGVRPCDLAAVAIQDRVLLGDRYLDTIYQERRKDVVFIAVNCMEPAGACFCASMGTGPKAAGGYDVMLTEVVQPFQHVFVAEAGSELGRELLEEVEAEPAPAEVYKQAEAALKQVAGSMRRKVKTQGIKEMLYDNFEHPRWEQVSGRCLSCGNCTLACPTCFCITVEDWSDVSQTKAARWRKWDSCFTQSFSYIHGGSVRQSPKSRYRQWLTHKFGAWIDQFGTSGCVGCGRCITWCPVGIDVTEELAALRGETAEAKA